MRPSAAATSTGLEKWNPCTYLAAHRVELQQLLGGLHAFGHDIHAKILRQRDDGRDHLRALALETHPADEGAIDLQGVCLQLVQVAQGRIARAEVIDAPLDADRLQAFQRRLRGTHVTDVGALGDFKLQAARVKARVAQDGFDLVRQTRRRRVARPTR